MQKIHPYSAAFGNIKRFKPEYILELVCKEMNVNIELIKKKCRQRELVDAKKMYCKLASVYTYASLRQIGECINIKHCGVVHLKKAANNHIINEPDFKSEYNRINKLFE